MDTAEPSMPCLLAIKMASNMEGLLSAMPENLRIILLVWILVLVLLEH